MGYSTDFTGQFDLNKPLTDVDFEFFSKLCFVRHMKRKFPGNKYGIEGEFFLDGEGKGEAVNEIRDSILDHNSPPSTQPSLWCDWGPTEDRLHFRWDGMEKFHHYVEWIQYIANILEERGYILSGSVSWQGEDNSDTGDIIALNNFALATDSGLYLQLSAKADEAGVSLDEFLCNGENLPPLVGMDEGLNKWIERKLAK